MKYGLEIEFFGKKKGQYVDAQLAGLPHDEYPLLIEARGKPFDDIFQAVASVRGEISRIVTLAATKGIKPVFENWCDREKVKELRDAILRRGLTKRVAHQNLTALMPSEMNETHIAAGMHISFTQPYHHGRFFRTKGVACLSEEITSNALWDFPQVFMKLSKEFEEEITTSKRTAGFYELKGDGRVEYRSLPATLIWAKNFDSRLSRCLS